MPGAHGPKTVKGARSDPNYMYPRLLARSECLPGGPTIIVTPLFSGRVTIALPLWIRHCHSVIVVAVCGRAGRADGGRATLMVSDGHDACC